MPLGYRNQAAGEIGRRSGTGRRGRSSTKTRPPEAGHGRGSRASELLHEGVAPEPSRRIRVSSNWLVFKRPSMAGSECPLTKERCHQSRRGRGPGGSRGFGATGAGRADLFSTDFPGMVYPIRAPLVSISSVPTFRGWFVPDYRVSGDGFTVFPGMVWGRTTVFPGMVYRVSGDGSRSQVALSLDLRLPYSEELIEKKN
jgi:hypothetical protein